MCESHHTMLKRLQGFKDDTFQSLPPVSRKKFSMGTNSLISDASLSPVVLPGPQDVTPQLSPVLRKKLWELDQSYHCIVIGTCLSLAELRWLQRRLGGSASVSATDYDLHRAFVGAVRAATPASRLIHKHLDRKYKSAIQQLGKARTRDELDAYWDTALASGEIAGAFWAVITRSDVPMAMLDRVYGEVHMLSHLSGASVRVDLHELNRLRRHCPALEAQLADARMTARRRLAEQQETIDALHERLTQSLETERQLQAAETRLAMLEEQSLATQLTAEVENLTARLDAEHARAEAAEITIESWKQQASRSIDQNQWLARQLAEMRHERDMLEVTLERLLSPPCAEVSTDAGPDLVGRCVLFVGGRQGQCVYFRELVERRNGRFIHHDGGRKDARARLWDVMQQADAILCPLDCVSHDAVHRIKRFCQRNTKPLVLLSRTSLAAFNRGLNAVVS